MGPLCRAGWALVQGRLGPLCRMGPLCRAGWGPCAEQAGALVHGRLALDWVPVLALDPVPGLVFGQFLRIVWDTWL